MINSRFSLIKDKVAIVTGASSGIGHATSLALAKAGAKVAIAARRTDRLQQLENDIKKMLVNVWLLLVMLQNEKTVNHWLML